MSLHRCLGLLLAMGLVVGCNSPEAEQNKDAQQRTSDSLLSNVLQQLRDEKKSVNSYRGAVQQLNVYLDGAEEQITLKLDPATRELLTGELLLKVPDSSRRLRDLESKTFNLADASHLDSCFLFRDAARVMQRDMGEAPPIADEAKWRAYNERLARYAFQWVMRQVQLTPRDGGSGVWPAHDVLRRGTGDPEERARVCLALFEQLNLFRTEERRLVQISSQLVGEPPGERRSQLEKEQAGLLATIGKFKLEAGLVVVPVSIREDDGTTRTQDQPWLLAVKVGPDLLLFDPRSGQPVTRADGKMATLAQAMAEPGSVGKVGLVGPVTPEQLAKASFQLGFSLPAVAPRMNWLESRFDQEGVQLHQNPAAQLGRLQAAKLGVPVKVWHKPASPGYPLAIVPLFVENPQQELALRQLIVPRHLLPDWTQDLLRELPSPRDQQRLIGDFDELFIRLRIEPGGVRDLLVRGKPEEAIQRIMVQEDRINRALDNFAQDVNPVPGIRKNWVPVVVARSQAIKDLLRQHAAAEEALRPGILQRVAEEYLKMNMLWRDRQAQFSTLAVVWAVPEYRAHLAYFMALAKIDLAGRAELQAEQLAGQPWPADRLSALQLWQSASEWLDRYEAAVLTLGRDPWGAAVAAQQQLCDQRIKALTAAK